MRRLLACCACFGGDRRAAAGTANVYWSAVDALPQVLTVLRCAPSQEPRVVFQNRTSLAFYGRLAAPLPSTVRATFETALQQARQGQPKTEQWVRSAAAGNMTAAAHYHTVHVLPLDGDALVAVVQVDMTCYADSFNSMHKDELLARILPGDVVDAMTSSAAASVQHVVARTHPKVTVMFLDVVGFTAMAGAARPVDILAFLNRIFHELDALLPKFGVQKVETIGDCYVVAAGVVESDNRASSASTYSTSRCSDGRNAAEDAARVVAFAQHAMHAASTVAMPDTGRPCQVRIGIHTGTCVSGVVGTKVPKFALFGEAMRVANMLESSAPPGRIHVSKSTRALLRPADRASFKPYDLLQLSGGANALPTFAMGDEPASGLKWLV